MLGAVWAAWNVVSGTAEFGAETCNYLKMGTCIVISSLVQSGTDLFHIEL